MKRFKLLITLLGVGILLLWGLFLPELPTRGEPPAKIFGEVWQTVNDNFYDSKFNGVDWKALKQKYESQVIKAHSQEEAADIINQMLAELKTSHTRFYTPLEPAYYQVLGIFAPRIPDLQQQLKKIFPQGKIEYSGIGIFTKDINGKTFVSGVLDGSPAANAGLLAGDRIISVEGRPFKPVQSFEGKAGQNVKMKIERSRSGDPGESLNTQQEITVTPKMLDATTMFLDAMQASTQIIERDGKKIGYVHIWSYAGDQYQEQLESDLFYGRLREADGLVLDLRDGWGGAPLGALNIYTARGPSVTNIRRDGRRGTDIAHWNKPVVMIVNEGSRSAKEILAYGFQQYDIGPVVGTKTAGAVVAGFPFLMSDNSLLYVAVADVYVDGNKRIEGVGVTPDVVVPFSPEYTQGADPQKERGIQVAIAAIKKLMANS
ncbi:S41 family peptidase [Microseira wollei]|uniref:Peptidase S41B n=2 Tax=Microseira wollei TaxID=467598 RepID=A0AAV3WF42_9CYAN|nr:peptidase S41B [Microseira wollei NIES-4236]